MTAQPRIKTRHFLGAGAAACAVCCAPPLLTLLGIAGTGAAATLATAVLAGVTFGAAVLVATIAALVAGRRRATTVATCDEPFGGAVSVSRLEQSAEPGCSCCSTSTPEPTTQASPGV